MRGVGGVAQEHHVLVSPGLVAHRGEVDPPRVVGQDLVAVEHVGEQLAHAGDRGVVGLARREVTVGVLPEAGVAPDLGVHLHDERAAVGVEGVPMDLHHPGRRLCDVELERVEDPVGAQPHVLAVALLQGGPEAGGVGGADRGVQPVGGDDEVVVGGERAHVRGGGAEPHLHAQLPAARLQDLQQPLARHRREAVPAAGDHLAAVVHVDVVPAGELRLHRAVHRRVGVLDAAERLVGEDDSEAEGVVGGVAFPDGDLVVRAELLGEGGEVQASGAATHHSDLHRHSRCRAVDRQSMLSLGRSSTERYEHE